jgi:hypothetical protein
MDQRTSTAFGTPVGYPRMNFYRESNIAGLSQPRHFPQPSHFTQLNQFRNGRPAIPRMASVGPIYRANHNQFNVPMMMAADNVPDENANIPVNQGKFRKNNNFTQGIAQKNWI